MDPVNLIPLYIYLPKKGPRLTNLIHLSMKQRPHLKKVAQEAVCLNIWIISSDFISAFSKLASVRTAPLILTFGLRGTCVCRRRAARILAFSTTNADLPHNHTAAEYVNAC